MLLEKPDSIIFDMDGTLWDALDAYVASWNQGFMTLNIDKRISREDISHMMGWEGRKVLASVLPEYSIEEQDKIYGTVNEIRDKLIADLGGVLYEGVKEGIERLSTKYPLFIVSNCPKGLIRTFTNWAGISDSIKDEMEYGLNLLPKNQNIKFLIDKHGLQKAVYVGDTDGDREQSELAGIPFVFLSFGFGRTERYAIKFDDFRSFTEYFMSL